MHLKMFVADHGHAKKHQIKSAIDRNHDVDFGKDDDAYDAFGLFLLGLTANGQLLPQTAKQIHVMDKMGFTLEQSVQ